MIVCGHGDVADFCKERDMLVVEQYEGDLEKYSGSYRILVTNQKMSESEYYYLKRKLLRRGVELISTRFKDCPALLEFLAYEAERLKEVHGVRQPFGFIRKNGEVMANPEMIAVARRVIELRDAGLVLRQIQEDSGVCRPDGRDLSLSTIQTIIKNRGLYE